MNRKQFLRTVAEAYDGDVAKAERALDAVTWAVGAELARGQRISLPGFGTFDRREVAARWVRNPRTGERIEARATAVARFRPGAQLKGIVAGLREVPQAPARKRRR
ncbi:hypothetical protein GCM10027425_21650 [Alteromonas gracilis]